MPKMNLLSGNADGGGVSTPEGGPLEGVARVAASLNAQFPVDGHGQAILVVPATGGARISHFVRDLGAALGRLTAKPILVLSSNSGEEPAGGPPEPLVEYSPGELRGTGGGDGSDAAQPLTLARLSVRADSASLPAFRDFLAAERQRYRFILIEGAPLPRSGPAMLLSQVAAGVLLVLSGGVSTAQEARLSASAVRLSGGKLLGFVIDEPRREK